MKYRFPLYTVLNLTIHCTGEKKYDKRNQQKDLENLNLFFLSQYKTSLKTGMMLLKYKMNHKARQRSLILF